MKFRENCSNIPWVQSQQSSWITYINHSKINPPIFQGLEKKVVIWVLYREVIHVFFVWGSFVPESPKGPNEIMKSDGDLRHQTSWVRDPQFLLPLKLQAQRGDEDGDVLGVLAIEVFVFVKYVGFTLMFFVWIVKGKQRFFEMNN